MSDNLHVIVGLGVTAWSCARYLSEQGIPIAFADTRVNPPNVERFIKAYPKARMSTGKLDEPLLSSATKLIVSPGVALREPALQRQIASGKPVIGDIELFAQATTAPIVAITGTNAKSTVTTLVGTMAEAAGLRSCMGGNLGTPALGFISS